MFVVKYRKLFYIISALIVAASISSISIWGLKPGIDFKGGSILEIAYTGNRPAQSLLEQKINPLNFDASIREAGDKSFIIRMRDISQKEKSVLDEALSGLGSTTQIRFDSVGPLLGIEAIKKSIASIVFVLIAIILFIAFAFRKVSKPINSWKYGFIAILALVHDVIVPTGVFAILGHYKGYEVDTLFVTALLVVLGFSIHDTIVVFDRVRENLSHAKANKPFEEIVGESITQTFTRSINTTLTTLMALIVLYFVGGESTHQFSLALIIGITAGTYSSVFLGSPLLVTIEKWQNRKNKGEKK
jgi:preprotein translocase subunit SecF